MRTPTLVVNEWSSMVILGSMLTEKDPELMIVNEKFLESPLHSLEVALESADEENKVGGLDFLAHRLQRVGTGVATSVQRVVFVEHRLAHCLGQYLRNITK